MSHQHHQQDAESMAEEYSIETPMPPEFLPYESGGAAVSYNNNEVPTRPTPPALRRVESEDDEADVGAHDEFVRHGRSPRFWLLTVGALVLVIAAVGGGVGVAMSGGGGGGGGDDSSPSAVTGTYDRPASSGGGNSGTEGMEEEIVEEVFGGVGDEVKENKQTGEVGNVVNLGAGTPGSVGETPNSYSSTSEVFEIILLHARYHGIEFQDQNSYQSLAARWVEETASVTSHTTRQLIQRYALACIYYATNGVENIYTKEIFGDLETRRWIDETGWLTDPNECNWYQITCNEDGWVIKIELYSNRLTGSFPPETALLKDSLEVIDLYQNMMHNTGVLGNHWLGELINIKELFFGRTYFEYDGIPTVIGKLVNLEEFDCSYTLYNGPLDGATFAPLVNLEYLHMGGNRYNSTIPIELAQLPSLEYLYAEYTDLTGDLSFVLMMPEIVELWIDRNPLMHGTIPSEIGTVDTLRSLSITDCNLDGTIPTELASLRLHQFWCYNNNLDGGIPSELGQVDTLVRLGVEGNDLSGTMPSEICANRAPEGLLTKLEADCEEGGPIKCDCCTCCGAECSGTPPVGTRL